MNPELFTPYIEEKLISVQVHPEAPHLKIYNYTQKCQFNSAWDEITLQARGLIFDHNENKVIARPFRKFFNIEEHVAKGLSIPTEEPIITEKYDGSLGILYWLNGKPRIATRGSFSSEQALWATKWLENHQKYPFDDMKKDVTYLYEIIYPQNRIVVNYDFEGLVFLSAIETETGNHSPHGYTFGRHAATWPTKSLEELKALALNNREGFVIHFPQENLRLKVKFEEYVRLHKILTGLSEKGVWEHLKNHGVETDVLDIAQDAPDEFYAWLQEVSDKLKQKYRETDAEAREAFTRIGSITENRKDFALLATKEKHPSLMFSLYDEDEKRYEQQIWKYLEPYGVGSMVFKKDIDS